MIMAVRYLLTQKVQIQCNELSFQDNMMNDNAIIII